VKNKLPIPKRQQYPIILPAPPPLPIPLQFSQTQPVPGATLDIQSLLRDLLEGKLEPSVIKKF
jgi:hypothetical protein